MLLAANLKKEGVKELPSGLQIKLLREQPNGKQIDNRTDFRYHYEGRLTDGTVLDSSFARNFPAAWDHSKAHTVNIVGLKEAVTSMRVGERAEFYLPSEIALGGQAAGPHLKGGDVLVYELEILHEITQKDEL